MPIAVRVFSPAKACSAWSSEDFGLCKARVIDADASTFFVGQSHNDLLPPDEQFVDQLRSVMQATAPQDEEKAILSFSYNLLNMLGFTHPAQTTQTVTSDPNITHDLSKAGATTRRVIRRNYDLPLFMGGRTTHAIADLCIVQTTLSSPHFDDESVLLLVKALPQSSITPPSSPIVGKADDSDSALGDPITSVEAQLLAQAVAAFQQHNRLLRRQRLPPIQLKVVPALLMIGSQPILYKIEVTADLVECIQSDRMPSSATKMNRLVLGDAGSQGGVDAIHDEPEALRGMVAVENRKKILKGLNAFKACL